MAKIFFFDLDGTLRETKSGKTFINEPGDQQPILGAQKAVSYYAKKGFMCIGITNQDGVAAGEKSLESAIEEQRLTLSFFPEMREIFMCTSYDGQIGCVVTSNEIVKFRSFSDISYRKPGHGMLLLAMQTIEMMLGDGPGDLEIDECWMTGDRQEDFECARAAGINFVWANIMLNRHTIAIANIDETILMKFLSI